MAITDDRDVRDAIWYATDAIGNRLQNDSLFIEKVKNIARGLGEQKVWIKGKYAEYMDEICELKLPKVISTAKIPTREEIEKKIERWFTYDLWNDCYDFQYRYTFEDGYKIESECRIPVRDFCVPTLLDDEDRARKQRAAINELIDTVLTHYNDKYSKEEYGMTGSEFKKIENDIRMVHGNITIAFDGECDTDFCVSKRKDTGNWIEGLPAIKKIETYNDRVTKVTFIDDTFTKSVCSENDHFDEDVGITICCMKRLFGKDGNRMYNDMIRKAHKVIDENNKKKEAKAKEEAERKLKAKKAACNKAAKKLLKKQEQIDIQAQAIIKAHRMLEDEQREEGLV